MKANSIINVPSNAADNSLPPPSMTAADSIGPAELTRVAGSAWVASAPQVLTKIDAEPLSHYSQSILKDPTKNGSESVYSIVIFVASRFK